MKNYLSLIFFLITLPLFAQSRENMIERLLQMNSSDEISLVQINSDPAGRYIADRSFRKNNSLSLTYAGPGNYSLIVQNGNVNTAEVNQKGYANYSDIYQTGNNNEIYLTMQGSNLSNSVEQSGDNNSIRQDLAGDAQKYIFSQKGDNNELIQTGCISGKLSEFEIIQRGNNMKLIITNSSN